MRAVGLVMIGSMMVASCAGSSGTDSSDDVSGAARPLQLTDPAATPAVDLNTATVDLDLIFFDTFDGGAVRLSDADAVLVARLFDAIPPIDAPSYEPVEQAADWLRPDDVVIGYVDPVGGTWAYPIRILNFHEIVNDDLGGQPVLISYCPLCASGAVYDRRLDERLLSFSNTSALYENDLVMVDRETGSYWWQAPGRAIVGELSGMKLTALVAETTTWGQWTADHGDTLVMSRPPGRDYSRDPFLSYPDQVDEGFTPFPVDPTAMSDGRLSPGTRVIVAELRGGTRAWPVVEPQSVSEELDGVSIEVTTNGVGGTVQADGEPVPVRTMLWFAAVAAYPDVTLGG